jgi:hypothetical protein
MDWSQALRNELRERAESWATTSQAVHYKSIGAAPTVLFAASSDERTHGNFCPDSWHEITTNAGWRERLRKRHTQVNALPEDRRSSACELDSSNSSDALLMNCFCFPGAAPKILQGLELPEQCETPVFGFKPRLEIATNGQEQTEIDMKIGSIIFEAKLTEKDFTSRPKAHVCRYQRFASVFEVDRLPVAQDAFIGYQLIRNVLAADQLNATLVVLIDQRRPDLVREWWKVHAAIRNAELRQRCTFRTWQEVAVASPKPLSEYLRTKYGM